MTSKTKVVNVCAVSDETVPEFWERTGSDCKALIKYYAKMQKCRRNLIRATEEYKRVQRYIRLGGHSVVRKVEE